MTSYWFYKMAANLLQVSGFDQTSQSTAEILLLPVSENKRPSYWNSTCGFDLDYFDVIVMWFCVCALYFIQIRPSAAKLWRHSDIQDGRRQPCWICYGLMVDHPRSVVDGCCYVLKFWLDRIYSFGDKPSAIFRFSRFGSAYLCPLSGGLGAYFPEMTSPIVLPPKDTSLRGNTPFEP